MAMFMLGLAHGLNAWLQHNDAAHVRQHNRFAEHDALLRAELDADVNSIHFSDESKLLCRAAMDELTSVLKDIACNDCKLDAGLQMQLGGVCDNVHAQVAFKPCARITQAQKALHDYCTRSDEELKHLRHEGALDVALAAASLRAPRCWKTVMFACGLRALLEDEQDHAAFAMIQYAADRGHRSALVYAATRALRSRAPPGSNAHAMALSDLRSAAKQGSWAARLMLKEHVDLT